MKISFIIASKNSERTIGYTIRSFLKQTSRDFEVIVIDNSTDRTPEILRKFHQENFRVIHWQDKCASEARNVGMAYATGEYIVFFDADDEINPCLVETLVDVINKYEPEIVIWNYKKVFGYIGQKLKVKKCESTTYQVHFPKSGVDFLKRIYLDKSFWIWIGNICYKASFLRELELKFPEEFIFGEDPDFSFKALCNSERCVYIDKTLAYYVQSPGSLTRNYHRRFPDQIYAFIDMANYAEQKYRSSGNLDFKKLSEVLKTQWVVSAFVNHYFLNFKNLIKKTRSLRETEKIFFDNIREYPRLGEILRFAIESTPSKGIYRIYKNLARNIMESINYGRINFVDFILFIVLRKIGDIVSVVKRVNAYLKR